MKNTAINSLGYTGIVTISQYIGSKKVKIAQIHNEGRKSLFNFIADCLAGDFDSASIDRPYKIMLLKATKDIGSDELILEKRSDFISLVSNPEKIYSPNSGIVRYSFIVTKDKLDTTDFNCIGLYAKSTIVSESDINNFAAICEVDTGEYQLSISSALVIDWELHVSNMED